MIFMFMPSKLTSSAQQEAGVFHTVSVPPKFLGP